ncbi:MAG: BamA/TamA family outer membrane protein [Aquimonas sp.]|nr:BamA/TamA family outer membrane protein [Aquimonas sp.]
MPSRLFCVPFLLACAPLVHAAEPACPTDGSLDPAALEAAGAVIGELRFLRRNVFDTDLPEENRALFRAANRLHRLSRESTLRKPILVEEGDPYRHRLLQESARLLRATEYLRDADLRPIACVDGRVVVEVETRDVWSLNPAISGSRRGGESSFGIDLEESNLLGLGSRIVLSRRGDADRNSTALRYRNAHEFGRWRGIDVAVEDNSDGSGFLVGVEQPFYALDVRKAWSVRIDHLTQVESFYDLGEEVSEYRQRNRDLDVWWGRSAGLQDGRVLRWTIGLRDQQRDFLPSRDPELLGPVPEDRHLAGPWIGLEYIRDEWEVLRNYDQIDISEDALLGLRFNVRLGRASETLGGDRDAWWTEGEASRGWRFASGDLLRFAGQYGARLEDGETRNLSVGGDLRYYRQTGTRRLFFAELEGQYGRELDLDNRAYLGGDNGLRGYPLRWIGGESYARLSLEQRYFTDWYPWRLFRVGGAVFADVGRVWGRDPLERPNPGLMSNVGLGLRLSNTRSAFARVIHIDLAVPLDGDPRLDRVELVLEARRAF